MIRKNDVCSKLESTWYRIDTLLKNDEERLKAYCEMFPTEDARQYEVRRKMYPQTFINISQDLISASTDIIFKSNVESGTKNKNSMLATFSENVIYSKIKLDYISMLREYLSNHLKAFGTVVVLMDKPKIKPVNRSDERINGMPYITIIDLLNVIDWEFDNDEMTWFKYKMKYRNPRVDPFETTDTKEYVYTWTKTDLIVSEGDTKESVINELSFTHNFGFVPIIVQSSFMYNPYDLIGNSPFMQTSNMILQANDMLNLRVYELKKHASALLVMNEESITNRNTRVDMYGESKIKKHDEGGQLLVSGDKDPFYLVKQLEVENLRICSEDYFQAALENERDMKSVIRKNSTGDLVEQSGIAKAIDREPMTFGIIAHEIDMENLTLKIMDSAAKILNVPNDYYIKFQRDIDARSQQQKYTDLKAAIDAQVEKFSETAMREVAKSSLSNISPDIETQQTINDEIDQWEPNKEAGIIENYLNETKEKPGEEKNKEENEEEEEDKGEEETKE